MSAVPAGRPAARTQPRLPLPIESELATFTDGDGLLMRQWREGPAGNVIWLVRPAGLRRVLTRFAEAGPPGSQDAPRVLRRVDRDLRVDPASFDRFALAPLSGRWQPFVRVARTGAWLPVGPPSEDLGPDLIAITRLWREPPARAEGTRPGPRSSTRGRRSP